METYLTELRNKIFKLLPMREDYDNGADNHLGDFLQTVIDGMRGAIQCYPELEKSRTFVDVQTSIASLVGVDTISFKTWRTTVLRSTRKLGSILIKREEARK